MCEKFLKISKLEDVVKNIKRRAVLKSIEYYTADHLKFLFDQFDENPLDGGLGLTLRILTGIRTNGVC